MCSNWAFRSGWDVPSRVLRLACKLYPACLNSRATVMWLTGLSGRLNSAANLRVLLQVHAVASEGRPASPALPMPPGFLQLRYSFRQPLPSAAGTTNPARSSFDGGRLQFPNSRANRVARQAGCSGNRTCPAPTQRQRFGGSPPASCSFVQFRPKGLKLPANPFNNSCIRHSAFLTTMPLLHKINWSNYFVTTP